MSDRDWVIDPLGRDAFEALAARLSGAELQSVLLEVVRRRAAARSPADLVAQYARDGFCAPAPIDQRESVALDSHLLAAAEGFEAIELSPVTPLGTCSVVALTDQNRVLGALRGTEVVSDPTNVLALVSAQRMGRAPAAPIHFVTSQRVVRAQPIPKVPGFAPHFRIFVLTSAGVETKDHGFTVTTLTRHVRTMLSALDRLEQHGYAFGARRVDILATAARAALGDRVAESLGAVASRKPLTHAYYSGGMRYMVWVTAPDGASVPLIDGGTFDWLQRLTSNRRAVYVTTGAGAQLMSFRFRVGASPPAQ